MKLKHLIVAVGTTLAIGSLVACSNVLTYIRHDEGRNTTCDGQKGIKRDAGGNCTIQVEPQK
ncbi:hypothetical protein [Enterobacter hormaechei]|uniref:hypothetical protein n=1 Tax=Enterobacter hormaechei TaxID=158836 RepID=UPI002A755808|nr:hypothetical protein [Enterobacter hormaechei]MDY3572304.1 hypothetical protein [Enterobacter hormaechei]